MVKNLIYMAEKGGQQEQMPGSQAEFQKLQQELGPLVEQMQKGNPTEKLKAAKRIMEILAIFKKVMGEEFSKNEQLTGLEQMAQQVMGQLEG